MENLKDRVTIYQVAQAAGVSLATVSRVINKQDNVTPATRKKVEETIARLGYKPSGLAQALATNRTTNIGLIIPNANYVYIANMLNGITEAARQKGLNITLFTTSHSREEALSMIEKIISTHVDGAIVFDDELGADDIAKINSYNVPTIIVNHSLTGERIGCVTFNYDEILSDLIDRYFVQGGKHEMTFLHVHNSGRLLASCEKAFIKTHDKLGRKCNVINCDDSSSTTYKYFMEYFKSTKEGFFIGYRDSIAAAVINAATDSGLKVPEDVEVLSLVGTKYADIVRPRMTSMNIDMQEVGKRSLYMLIDLMNHELIDRVAHFEPEVVIRNSTTVAFEE